MPSPYYPIIVPVTLSAKKGDSQKFYIGIRHSIPYPSIESGWGRTWQDLGTLEPNKYRNSGDVRLEQKYHGALLWRDEGCDGSRRDNAGWDITEWEGGQRKHTVMPSPMFKGKSLGEVEFTVGDWKPDDVRISGSFSDTARAWLHSSLGPVIVQAIKDNRELLRKDALDKLRERFAEGVKRLRDDADKREQEALAILKAIGADKE